MQNADDDDDEIAKDTKTSGRRPSTLLCVGSLMKTAASSGERSNFEKFVARLVATQLDASQQKKVHG
eukprot:2784128-Amphidinium_carterae.1